MSFLINPFSFRSGAGLPTRSLDFEASSSQYLSMSDGDFGTYDRTKFGFSCWVKRESLGTGSVAMTIMTKNLNAVASAEFRLQFWVDDRLNFATWNGGVINGQLYTNASYTSTANWYHILAWYDSANATANERMRLWVDGVEITSFAARTNPTQNQAVQTTANNVIVSGNNSLENNPFDGLAYQLGFFSGTLPSIGDVYNAGSPKDISGLPGLYSYLDCAGNDPTSDGVLATSWTNNNSVTTSTDIPT